MSINFILIKNLWIFMKISTFCILIEYEKRCNADEHTRGQTCATGNALFSKKPPISVTLRSANADRPMDALSSDAHSWAATNRKAEKRCRFFRGLQGVSWLNISAAADSNALSLVFSLVEN